MAEHATFWQTPAAIQLSFSLSVACLLVGAPMRAQNLIPNGSFEEYINCPPYFGYCFYAAGWFGPDGSPDYFNACHTGGVVGIPLNQLGDQYPADGNAYMGLSTSAIGGVPWYREIIGAQLTEPLIPGVPVCLSFKTAMGGFGNFFGNSTIYSCKGLGMKFFTAFPTDWAAYLYPNSAAIALDIVPTDTAMWYSVADEYVPDSAYGYVAIGNFFADSLIELTLIDTMGVGGNEVAYAFVDDVRASFDLNFCTQDLGGLEFEVQAPVLFPMPFDDVLHIRLPKQASGYVQYALWDAVGRRVQHGSTTPGSEEVLIPDEGLPDGVYVLYLRATQLNWAPVTVVHLSH